MSSVNMLVIPIAPAFIIPQNVILRIAWRQLDCFPLLSLYHYMCNLLLLAAV